MASNELVQSVTRSLDILEIIGRAEDGLSLQAIAQDLGVAPPTAHNLLRTLAARGYLEKSQRPTRYRLGEALFALVRQQGQRRFVHRAAAVVQQLARKLPGTTVTLTEARGGELQVLLRMSPELPDLLQRPDGMTMNVYLAAHGLVFQAFWTEAERAAFRRRYPFDEYGAHAWHSLADLDETLVGVRACGYAEPSSANGHLFRVAAPIFSATHTLIASLGISIHADRLLPGDRERIITSVMKSARQLTPDAREEDQSC